MSNFRFIISFAPVLIAGLAIAGALALSQVPPQSPVTERCVAGYVVIDNPRTGPRQILSARGTGIPCKEDQK